MNSVKVCGLAPSSCEALGIDLRARDAGLPVSDKVRRSVRSRGRHAALLSRTA